MGVHRFHRFWVGRQAWLVAVATVGKVAADVKRRGAGAFEVLQPLPG